MIKIIFPILVFIMIANTGLGQPISIKVNKTICILGKNGSYINVEVNKDGKLFDSSRQRYDYSKISRLSDSLRIEIIEKLFQFMTDTSLCCNRVFVYDNYEHYDCGSGSFPQSKKMSIRIEAMFIMNRICYSYIIDRISCFPVLYDQETMQEINDNNSLIDIMVQRYRDWFALYKKTGKRPSYDYINGGRIVWWGR